MAVRVVVDSTADLPQQTAQAEGITVVPLNVHFGDEVFKDGVDLSYDQFWDRLRAGEMPRTSQPSPLDFLAAWKPILESGDEVLSIHLSHDFSGTVGSAQIARDMAGEDASRITVLDSRSVTMGLGMAAIEAARLAKGGANAPELAAVAAGITGRAQILFTLNNLDMLLKNGRIGRASALVGSLLGILPILKVEDGAVGTADKVRGKNKVFPRCAELLQERIPRGSRVRFSVVYGDDRGVITPWVEMVEELYQVEESWATALGPVVSSHVGFGVAGLILYETR